MVEHKGGDAPPAFGTVASDQYHDLLNLLCLVASVIGLIICGWGVCIVLPELIFPEWLSDEYLHAQVVANVAATLRRLATYNVTRDELAAYYVAHNWTTRAQLDAFELALAMRLIYTNGTHNRLAELHALALASNKTTDAQEAFYCQKYSEGNVHLAASLIYGQYGRPVTRTEARDYAIAHHWTTPAAAAAHDLLMAARIVYYGDDANITERLDTIRVLALDYAMVAPVRMEAQEAAYCLKHAVPCPVTMVTVPLDTGPCIPVTPNSTIRGQREEAYATLHEHLRILRYILELPILLARLFLDVILEFVQKLVSIMIEMRV